MTGPYTLDDAAARHREYPDTFEVPDPDDLAALAPGDFVKLTFIPDDAAGGKPERMWVKVTAISAFGGVGTLSSNPVNLPLEHGDEIKFAAHNVLSIYRGEPL